MIPNGFFDAIWVDIDGGDGGVEVLRGEGQGFVAVTAADV